MYADEREAIEETLNQYSKEELEASAFGSYRQKNRKANNSFFAGFL